MIILFAFEIRPTPGTKSKNKICLFFEYPDFTRLHHCFNWYVRKKEYRWLKIDSFHKKSILIVEFMIFLIFHMALDSPKSDQNDIWNILIKNVIKQPVPNIWSLFLLPEDPVFRTSTFWKQYQVPNAANKYFMDLVPLLKMIDKFIGFTVLPEILLLQTCQENFHDITKSWFLGIIFLVAFSIWYYL